MQMKSSMLCCNHPSIKKLFLTLYTWLHTNCSWLPTQQVSLSQIEQLSNLSHKSNKEQLCVNKEQLCVCVSGAKYWLLLICFYLNWPLTSYLLSVLHFCFYSLSPAAGVDNGYIVNELYTWLHNVFIWIPSLKLNNKQIMIYDVVFIIMKIKKTIQSDIATLSESPENHIHYSQHQDIVLHFSC